MAAYKGVIEEKIEVDRGRQETNESAEMTRILIITLGEKRPVPRQEQSFS